jgi:parallel beta-helix repeat (two copies)
VFTQSGALGIVNATNAGDITIRDLYIDHDGNTATSSVSAIQFSTGTGQNYLIDNVHIFDAGQDAIRIVGGSGIKTNVKVVNCTVDTTDRHGIEFSTDVSSGVIANNRLRNCNTVTVGAAIYAGSDSTANGITVTGNVVETTVDNGIRTIGADISITGNHITGAGIDGIRIAGNRNAAVGNTVRACTEQGIKAENGTGFTITGNNVTNCLQDGIMVRYSTALPRNVSIAGNYVSGNTQNGIRIYGGSDITITGNTVPDNTQGGIVLEGPTVGGSRAVTRVVVGNNNLYNNGASYDNITVKETGGTIGYVTIAGNTCNGNSSTNGGINITVAAPTRVDVVDNISFGHVTSDLSIPAGNVVYIRHTDFRSPFAAPTMAAINGSMWFATTGAANQAAYIRENTAWVEVGAM